MMSDPDLPPYYYYETKWVPFDVTIKLTFGRKDDEPMTQEDIDALVAAARKSNEGEAWLDESERPEDNDGRACFTAVVEFERSVEVDPADCPTDSYLRHEFDREEIAEESFAIAKGLFGEVGEKYECDYYDIDY